MLDLRPVIGVHTPLAAQHERYRDFVRLYDRAAFSPGKSGAAPMQATAVKQGRGSSHGKHGKIEDDEAMNPTATWFKTCMGFTIFGTRGTFSPAHVDLLNGTLIRCLEGVKAWMIVVDPTEQDLEEWRAAPASWTPEPDKIRDLILEKGDTLIMPPGVLIIHAPITIADCLMEGGMIGDSLRRDCTILNLVYIQRHSETTNERPPDGGHDQVDLAELRRLIEDMPGIKQPHYTVEGKKVDEVQRGKRQKEAR